VAARFEMKRWRVDVWCTVLRRVIVEAESEHEAKEEALVPAAWLDYDEIESIVDRCEVGSVEVDDEG